MFSEDVLRGAVKKDTIAAACYSLQAIIRVQGADFFCARRERCSQRQDNIGQSPTE